MGTHSELDKSIFYKIHGVLETYGSENHEVILKNYTIEITCSGADFNKLSALSELEDILDGYYDFKLIVK